MKTLILSLLAMTPMVLTSCNDSKKQQNTTETSMVQNGNGMSDSSSMGNMPMDAHMAVTDAKKTSANLAELYSHYTHLTFALSADDSNEAVNGAKGILEALPKIDQSGFSEEQKKNYSEITASIREHATHIADNAADIEHQREHLDLISADFYDLVKGFGAPKPVYKVFCPMYNNKKGAFWLSDSREIKNPYFGKKMISCGEIKEEIK